MAYRVVWSPRAFADVEAIASYIASDSNFYANAVGRRIVALANAAHRHSHNYPRSCEK